MKQENNKIKDELKNCFQGAYGKKLTDAEVEEIKINLTGFFKLLSDYNKKDTEEKEKLQKNGKDSSV